MPAVLIVAHAPLASALKAVAEHVYADTGHAVCALDVAADADTAKVQTQARALMAVGDESEWLVLTDVYGATPCNAMRELAEGGAPELRLQVITGVNVPMLWRTLCYADESLEMLADRALAGAGKGLMQVVPAPVAPPGTDDSGL